MRFRVMTYNIHRAIGVDRRFRIQRIAGIIEHHEPDIVLLQEVDEGAPRSRCLNLAESLAEALQFEHFVLGHNVQLSKGRYGNATLSRFPIVRHRNIDLTIGTRKRRGCQHTTLQLSGGNSKRELEVFNLHLGLSAAERARQVGRLCRAPEFEQLAADQPCLVGGDFNDWRLLLHPVFLDVLRFDCATERAGVDHGSLRTYPSFAPRGELDRIYHRGVSKVTARTCRLRASRVASDHLPIIADFEFG